MKSLLTFAILLLCSCGKDKLSAEGTTTPKEIPVLNTTISSQTSDGVGDTTRAIPYDPDKVYENVNEVLKSL